MDKLENSDIRRFPFPYKLWLVINLQEHEFLRWDRDGTTFLLDLNGLEIYLHSENSIFAIKNVPIFVQHLNDYQFRQIGNHLNNTNAILRFKNEDFQRGHMELVSKIRRPKFGDGNPNALFSELICELASNETPLNEIQSDGVYSNYQLEEAVDDPLPIYEEYISDKLHLYDTSYSDQFGNLYTVEEYNITEDMLLVNPGNFESTPLLRNQANFIGQNSLTEDDRLAIQPKNGLNFTVQVVIDENYTLNWDIPYIPTSINGLQEPDVYSDGPSSSSSQPKSEFNFLKQPIFEIVTQEPLNSAPDDESDSDFDMSEFLIFKNKLPVINLDSEIVVHTMPNASETENSVVAESQNEILSSEAETDLRLHIIELLTSIQNLTQPTNQATTFINNAEPIVTQRGLGPLPDMPTLTDAIELPNIFSRNQNVDEAEDQKLILPDISDSDSELSELLNFDTKTENETSNAQYAAVQDVASIADTTQPPNPEPDDDQDKHF